MIVKNELSFYRPDGPADSETFIFFSLVATVAIFVTVFILSIDVSAWLAFLFPMTALPIASAMALINGHAAYRLRDGHYGRNNKVFAWEAYQELPKGLKKQLPPISAETLMNVSESDAKKLANELSEAHREYNYNQQAIKRTDITSVVQQVKEVRQGLKAGTEKVAELESRM